jgi:hypothetical protein
MVKISLEEQLESWSSALGFELNRKQSKFLVVSNKAFVEELIQYEYKSKDKYSITKQLLMDQERELKDKFKPITLNCIHERDDKLKKLNEIYATFRSLKFKLSKIKQKNETFDLDPSEIVISKLDLNEAKVYETIKARKIQSQIQNRQLDRKLLKKALHNLNNSLDEKLKSQTDAQSINELFNTLIDTNKELQKTLADIKIHKITLTKNQKKVILLKKLLSKTLIENMVNTLKEKQKDDTRILNFSQHTTFDQLVVYINQRLEFLENAGSNYFDLSNLQNVRKDLEGFLVRLGDVLERFRALELDYDDIVETLAEVFRQVEKLVGLKEFYTWYEGNQDILFDVLSILHDRVQG